MRTLEQAGVRGLRGVRGGRGRSFEGGAEEGNHVSGVTARAALAHVLVSQHYAVNAEHLVPIAIPANHDSHGHESRPGAKREPALDGGVGAPAQGRGVGEDGGSRRGAVPAARAAGNFAAAAHASAVSAADSAARAEAAAARLERGRAGTGAGAEFQAEGMGGSEQMATITTTTTTMPTTQVQMMPVVAPISQMVPVTMVPVTMAPVAPEVQNVDPNSLDALGYGGGSWYGGGFDDGYGSDDGYGLGISGDDLSDLVRSMLNERGGLLESERGKRQFGDIGGAFNEAAIQGIYSDATVSSVFEPLFAFMQAAKKGMEQKLTEGRVMPIGQFYDLVASTKCRETNRIADVIFRLWGAAHRGDLNYIDQMLLELSKDGCVTGATSAAAIAVNDGDKVFKNEIRDAAARLVDSVDKLQPTLARDTFPDDIDRSLAPLEIEHPLKIPGAAPHQSVGALVSDARDQARRAVFPQDSID